MKNKLRAILYLPFVLFSITANAQIDQIDILPNNGAANDVFGSSSAISDDFLVVGAPLKNNGVLSNTGEVYVYQKNGEAWDLMTSLLASDGEADDRFGSSVAIDGNTIVVGAPFDDDINNSSGAVYVFDFDGTTWNETVKITDANLMANDEFGHSVSISGDWIAVGVPKDDDLNSNSGATWMYEKIGTTWTLDGVITSHVTEFGEELFGYDVSIDGTKLAVGSTLDDDAATDAGTVFIYDYDGTTWNFEQKLSPSDGGNSFSYGFSIDIDNNQLIVGAYGGNPSLLSAGAAYIYQFDGTTWNEQQILFAGDATADDWFGYQVAIDGETAIASSINDDDNGTSSGSVYVFRWDQTEWIQEFKVISSDGNNGDEYGISLALNNLDFTVGAYKRDISGNNSGKSYAYSLCSYKPAFDLCMATVDSTNQGHWILFEMPRATLLDSFYVYTATPNTAFTRIGGIAYGETPELYNGNVDLDNDTVYYYLATVNVCGKESVQSEIQKPMRTTAQFVSNGTKVKVMWTPYEGYDFTYYRIWRDDNNTGNWQLIGSQLDYLTDFVDQNPPSSNQNLQYRIEAFGGMNCILSHGYENSISNVFNPNNYVAPSNITTNQLGALEIYPNPATDYLQVNNVKEPLQYKIVDISGRMVTSGTINQNQRVDIGNINPGNYLFFAISKQTGEQIIHKFVVQ